MTAALSNVERIARYIADSALIRAKDELGFQRRYLAGLRIQALLRQPKVVGNVRQLRRIAR